MQLVFLCSLLLPPVLGTSFGGGNSAVITRQDVHQGLNEANMFLVPGRNYRVYATYASSEVNDDYVSKIVIKDRNNVQFTVADLAKPKTANGYFLDENRIMTAPITIVDNHQQPATGFLLTPPYVIYIVATNVMVSPVISARLINGQVDSSAAEMNSPSCTVLSAEPSMLFSNIDTGSSFADEIAVKTSGYDALSDDNTVLTVTKETPGSSVMISGPIATLYNTNAQNANFNFNVQRSEGPWTGSIRPGASITFLSDGWLSVDESYQTMYVNDDAKWRNYDFGRDIQVQITSIGGNYFPNYDSGDLITVTCHRDNGKSTDYHYAIISNTETLDWCRRVELYVNVGTHANKTTGIVEGPRFRVQIESGAFSTSIFALLVASLIGVLIH